MVLHLVLCGSVAAWRDAIGLEVYPAILRGKPATRFQRSSPSRSLSAILRKAWNLPRSFAGLLPDRRVFIFTVKQVQQYLFNQLVMTIRWMK